RGTGDEPLVGERAVMAVDPQLVRSTVVRDVDVEPAVAVVVADGDAEARAVRLGGGGLRRDVDGKPAAGVFKKGGAATTGGGPAPHGRRADCSSRAHRPGRCTACWPRS